MLLIDIIIPDDMLARVLLVSAIAMPKAPASILTLMLYRSLPKYP